MIARSLFAALAASLLASAASAETVTGSAGSTIETAEVATFEEPWAMAILPDGSTLVTEKRGVLTWLKADGTKVDVKGVPRVDYGGQGGLGDVVLHPDFATNNRVYLSWAEAGTGDTRGAVVAMATLKAGGEEASLEDVEIIWKQEPKVTGRGHYSHRILFGPAGGEHAGKMFISSGDRQKMTPAQDTDKNLGKIVRLNDDGSVAEGNPWQDKGELAKSFWSMGHRNVLGIAFDGQGRLWNTEMGPKGGDELNIVTPAANYGWPVVSEGEHYNGRDIPAHATRPEFQAPKTAWTPVISPAGLIFVTGDTFADWTGNALIPALSAKGLVRVAIEGDTAREVERFDMGARIRDVEQGPDGALYVLEDGRSGRLLKVTPRQGS